MELRCLHCHEKGEHWRAHFFGHWVICHACERPFEWREAWMEAIKTAAQKVSGTSNNGAKR